MMGSFLTRLFIMALGYAYPAYECFKTVEKNKPEIEQLRFWCQYWILVAVLSVFERVGDTFISWLPLYSEAKLAFFIYLWYPKTKGTTYVYDAFLRPYVAKHETVIDQNLLELRARAGDIVVLYWQKATTYSQTRFLEILHYVASQSHGSRSRPVQQREQQVRPPPSTPTARVSPALQTQMSNVRAPSSPVKGKAHGAKEGGGPAAVPPPLQTQVSSCPSKPPTSETNSPSASSVTEPMQVGASEASTNEDSSPPPPQETVMEETIRLTRGRLRRTRAASTANHASIAVTAAGGATSH